MALPIIACTYARMGRIFERVFGQSCIITTKEGVPHVIGCIYSPEFNASVVRGYATQTRDMPLISLRREALVGIFGESADVIIAVQESTFSLPEGPDPAMIYRLDDVVDDTKIMVEGRLMQVSSSLTEGQGSASVSQKARVNRILG